MRVRRKDSASNQTAQTAPAAQTEGASLTVKTARGDANVPQNPERIAVYDLGVLDTLSKLGVKTGLSVDTNRLPYLDEYSKSTKPAGTLFEPDYEALNAYKPQLIIIGSRAAKAFDKLNEIAPTIEMTARYRQPQRKCQRAYRRAGANLRQTGGSRQAEGGNRRVF